MRFVINDVISLGGLSSAVVPEDYGLENVAVQNVKGQIGFCGIWCGSCAGGNGAIVELARRFEELAGRQRLEKWVPKNFDFQEFMKGLASIKAMSLCPGCRKGGGNPACKVRICALQKGVNECSSCEALLECRNFEQLENENPKRKQFLLDMKGASRSELIAKWTNEIRKKWPHCIVYCTPNEKQ